MDTDAAMPQPPTPSSGFRDHFSAAAPGYAEFRPHYPAALFERLAALAPSRALAWDCAAGSGQATVGLAPLFDRVVATDAAAAQLAQAPRLPNVEYRVAPAEASGLAAGSVALVTVAQALHWFDLERFYAEVRRVLAPGGVVAAWTYGLQRVDGGPIDRALDHYYRDVVGPYWPPERRLVETGYRTLPWPFEEPAFDAPPMTADWTLAQQLGYLATWSATLRYVRDRGGDPIGELGARLAPLWGEPEVARRIEWPLAVRVGRG